MADMRYYDILLGGIPADTGLTVARIVRGVAWTAAVLSDGSCGVGMRTAGETVARRFETLEGLPLRAAAGALLSWNLEEASEGMAVVNAWYDRADRAEALGCFYTDNSLEGIDLKGKTVGFVGHLVRHGGAAEDLLSEAKRWFILEREPKPGDYPDSACEFLLPQCDVAVITGSAAINKTLPRLLELCGGAEIVLTGPSVSLCPALTEEYRSIRRLNFSAITEPEALLGGIVRERGSVGPYGRYFTFDPC